MWVFLCKKVKLCTPGELIAALFLQSANLPEGQLLFEAAKPALFQVTNELVRKVAALQALSVSWNESNSRRSLRPTGYYDWVLREMLEKD